MFGSPQVFGRSTIFWKPSHDHFLTSFGLTENLLHKEPRIKRMIYILHLFLCSHGLDSKTVTSAGGRRLVQLSCKHNNNFLKSSLNRKLPIHHCSSRGQKECHCKCRRMWWRFATEIAGCKVSGTSARVSWSLGTLAGMAMVQRCHLYLENRLCQVCGHLRLPPRLRLEV